jgi:hypothetical protein
MKRSACWAHEGRRLYASPSQAHSARRVNLRSESGNRIELVSHCKSCHNRFLAPTPLTFRELRRTA